MKALVKLHDISKALASHNIDAPDKEAEIILRSVLAMRLSELYRDNPELSSDQLSEIEQIVSRRSNREPLQYIIGHVDFTGLKIFVGKGVLIPRPETELMAEIAMRMVKGADSRLRILDLCTGSGCLALALAKEFPDAEVYGVDISDVALSYAKKNAELNNIGNVTFLRGSLFEPLKCNHASPSVGAGPCGCPPQGQRQGQPQGGAPTEKSFDLIISNPPYIKTADMRDLQPEIKDWEPLNALDGGAEGLDYYTAIIPSAREFLKENGILILELGIDCADGVKEMLLESGYSDVELIKDYAGIERIAVGRK